MASQQYINELHPADSLMGFSSIRLPQQGSLGVSSCSGARHHQMGLAVFPAVVGTKRLACLKSLGCLRRPATAAAREWLDCHRRGKHQRPGNNDRLFKRLVLLERFPSHHHVITL